MLDRELRKMENPGVEDIFVHFIYFVPYNYLLRLPGIIDSWYLQPHFE